jgi:hypothetical protein
MDAKSKAKSAALFAVAAAVLPFILDTILSRLGEDTLWYAILSGVSVGLGRFLAVRNRQTGASNDDRKRVLDALGGGGEAGGTPALPTSPGVTIRDLPGGGRNSGLHHDSADDDGA